MKESEEIPKHDNYLVFDLEATCCNKDSLDRDSMEIIEIGAVMVDGKTFEIIDEFCTFIKPVRNPTLTPFCKRLTTITQIEVDTAPEYKEALELFKNWYAGYEDVLICSWGNYDKKQFSQDSRFHGVESPTADNHCNMKRIFSLVKGVKRRFGVKNALLELGMEFDGTAHRGIDDARNTARLAKYTFGD